MKTILKSTVACCLLPVSALAMEATLELGYDSNPYKISSPPNGAQFTRASAHHKGDRALENSKKLQYSLSVASELYGSGESDADNHRFDGRLRWINRFKIGERSANFMLTGDWRSERKTYFSQTQRQVATASQGDSLADRFDYDSAKIAGEFIYRIDKRSSVSLYSYVSRRQYVEDYSDLDLEQLDYNEVNLQPTVRYKADSGLYVRGFVYRKVRYYDDLLNDNLDGRNIDDSTVEYQMDGYGVLVKYPVTPTFDVSVYASGYYARDNSQGYRDMDYQKLSMDCTWKLSHGAELSWQANMYSRDYLEDSARPPESETGNAGRLREGTFSEVKYSRPLSLVKDHSMRWHIRVTNQWEDNSDDYLSYERHLVGMGMSYQF
jgi:hypothetical protein